MLQYYRTDVSEGIDVNKTSASKECDICHHWYFKDVCFKYEPYNHIFAMVAMMYQ